MNEEDPVKAGLVNDRINTLITQANLKLSKKVTGLAATYLDAALAAAATSACSARRSTSSASRTRQKILESIQPELPKDSPFAADLARVINVRAGSPGRT